MLVPACRPAGAPAPQGPVRVVLQGPVASLDPTLSEPRALAVLANVFEPLVAYDRNLQLRPSLAIRWETPDETTWLFTLRPGVTFHDGSPLDAAAVVESLERARSTDDSNARGALWAVSRVEAVGADTVRIATRAPDALLLHELTLPLVARGGSRAAVEARPIGTGPYRVVSWTRKGALELEAWDRHWGGVPPVRRLRVLPLPAGADPVLAISRGDADAAEVPLSAARRNPPAGVRFFTQPGLTTFYLWMNGPAEVEGRPNPFWDVRVRRAAARAIDRARLALEATGTRSTAAPQLVPRTVFGHVGSIAPLPFDPAAARALLQATGRPLPVAATLVYREDGGTERAARLLKEMLDAAGFSITVRAVAGSEVQRVVLAGRLTLFLGGWVFDGPDAGGFLRDCIRSRDASDRTGLFNPGYRDLEIDRLVDASHAAFSRSDRLALLEEAIRLATEDAPLVPLYHRPDAWAVSERLDWSPRPDGRFLASEIGAAKGSAERLRPARRSDLGS